MHEACQRERTVYTAMKLWNATLQRKQRDRTHLVVVDEASLFQTNPMPRMLAESRKFGLAMVLSHQHMGQLTDEVRTALEANSANFSSFRLSPTDVSAALFRFGDATLASHLTRLDAFHAISTMSVDSRQTSPFTLQVRVPKIQDKGEEIAAEIEAESIRTLVESYSYWKAMTHEEIEDYMAFVDWVSRKFD